MNIEDRIDAVWCHNSETGEKVLIDRLTNKIISGEPAMESKYPVMTEAEETFQRAYKQGREDEAAAVEEILSERDEELRDLLDQNEALKRNIANFLKVGVGLFNVELSNEQ